LKLVLELLHKDTNRCRVGAEPLEELPRHSQLLLFFGMKIEQSTGETTGVVVSARLTRTWMTLGRVAGAELKISSHHSALLYLHRPASRLYFAP
jgi:hypothetical protein